MIVPDPSAYLPSPGTIAEARELAEDLLQAAEQAARWLAASLEVQQGKSRRRARR